MVAEKTHRCLLPSIKSGGAKGLLSVPELAPPTHTPEKEMRRYPDIPGGAAEMKKGTHRTEFQVLMLLLQTQWFFRKFSLIENGAMSFYIYCWSKNIECKFNIKKVHVKQLKNYLCGCDSNSFALKKRWIFGCPVETSFYKKKNAFCVILLHIVRFKTLNKKKFHNSFCWWE